MGNRITLWVNKEKEIPDGVTTRDLDQEAIICRCVAYGIHPVKIEIEIQEGSNKETIWVHFLPDEIETFDDKWFANEEIFTSVRMQAYASDWWKGTLVNAKSKRRYLIAQTNGN